MPRLVLGVKYGSSSVIISEPQSNLNQLWDFDGDGTVGNKMGLVLDVGEGSNEPLTPVIVNSKHGGWNQIFRVVPIAL